MIALITGGSGSGKSAYAERLLASLSAEKRVYVATMQVMDEESRCRVERHRAQRAGLGFDTVESPLDLASAPIPQGAAVLVECLPNLLANEMFSGGDPDRIPAALDDLAERCAHLVMVTDDVFSDGVTYDESTMEYIRRLAQVNRHAAHLADYAAEVVYTIPIPLKGDAPCPG